MHKIRIFVFSNSWCKVKKIKLIVEEHLLIEKGSYLNFIPSIHCPIMPLFRYRDSHCATQQLWCYL